MVIGETPIQARHVTELRDAINAVRAHFNLPNYQWAKPTVSGGAINTSVAISWEAIDEMRTALNQALGPSANGYAPNLGANQPVKAIHIQELRDRVTNTWSLYGTSIAQAYDGDGLRVKKTQSGNSTYYLRSAVLGGQVIAELNYDQTSGWFWSRGYVYSGSSLLAVQDGGVFWVYEDPVTKSKRVCDANGNVVSGIETDPFGADTNRSWSQAFQPRIFTSYERDANGSDEAMFRRYNRWHSRFDQPDPYGASYNPPNPQSLNRYAYVGNDPVNFRDPFGLDGKPGDLCPGGVIGNDGKCYAGPSATVTVTGSLFGDYLPDWTNNSINLYGYFGFNGPTRNPAANFPNFAHPAEVADKSATQTTIAARLCASRCQKVFRRPSC